MLIHSVVRGVVVAAFALPPTAMSMAAEPELEFVAPSAPLLPSCERPEPKRSEDTTYEALVACGLYPQETRLECIIEIKEATCYGGGIDTAGSFEHVLMCVDWNGDSSFSPKEVVGEVAVQIHNESAVFIPPWSYAVYRDFAPPGGVRTDLGNILGGFTTTTAIGWTYKARAILSYDAAPTGCDFVPAYGNVLNFRIRMDPIR